MAVTKKGTIHDGVKGASIEFGTFTIDPASLNPLAEAEETFALDGVNTGDLIFINPISLTAGLHAKGARVTATDVVGVTLRNDNTQAVNGGSITYGYFVVRFGL